MNTEIIPGSKDPFYQKVLACEVTEPREQEFLDKLREVTEKDIPPFRIPAKGYYPFTKDGETIEFEFNLFTWCDILKKGSYQEWKKLLEKNGYSFGTVDQYILYLATFITYFDSPEDDFKHICCDYPFDFWFSRILKADEHNWYCGGKHLKEHNNFYEPRAKITAFQKDSDDMCFPRLYPFMVLTENQ